VFDEVTGLSSIGERSLVFLLLFVDLVALRSDFFSGDESADDDRLDDEVEPDEDDELERLDADEELDEPDELEPVELDREREWDTRLRLFFDGDSREFFIVSVSTVIISIGILFDNYLEKFRIMKYL